MKEPLLGPTGCRAVVAKSLGPLLTVQLLELLEHLDVRGRVDGGALGDKVLVYWPLGVEE